MKTLIIAYGEGGAGTYSDGKLYTRSLKRGDVRRIFENSGLPWRYRPNLN